jgi:hypothetical protein
MWGERINVWIIALTESGSANRTVNELLNASEYGTRAEIADWAAARETPDPFLTY